VFELINPFASNTMLISRERDKRPSVVGLQSLNFFTHGLSPLKIRNCLVVVLWFISGGYLTDKMVIILI